MTIKKPTKPYKVTIKKVADKPQKLLPAKERKRLA